MECTNLLKYGPVIVNAVKNNKKVVIHIGLKLFADLGESNLSKQEELYLSFLNETNIKEVIINYPIREKPIKLFFNSIKLNYIPKIRAILVSSKTTKIFSLASLVKTNIRIKELDLNIDEYEDKKLSWLIRSAYNIDHISLNFLFLRNKALIGLKSSDLPSNLKLTLERIIIHDFTDKVNEVFGSVPISKPRLRQSHNDYFMNLALIDPSVFDRVQIRDFFMTFSKMMINYRPGYDANPYKNIRPRVHYKRVISASCRKSASRLSGNNFFRGCEVTCSPYMFKTFSLDRNDALVTKIPLPPFLPRTRF